MSDKIEDNLNTDVPDGYCFTCKSYVPISSNKECTIGKCFRFPATLVDITQKGYRKFDHPTVESDDFCGEYSKSILLAAGEVIDSGMSPRDLQRVQAAICKKRELIAGVILGTLK